MAVTQDSEPEVPLPSPPGGSSLGFLLSATFRVMRQIFSKRMAVHGLTPPQHGLLLFIRDAPGFTLAEIARRVRADTPTLCRVVDRLHRRGLVERVPRPEDRRCLTLQLTSPGRRLARLGHKLGSDVEQRLLHGFTREESETLRELLQRLLRNAISLSDEDAES